MPNKEKINELIEKYDLLEIIRYNEQNNTIESIIKPKTDEEDLFDFIHFYIGQDNKLMDLLIKLNYSKILEKAKITKSNYYAKFIYEYDVEYNSSDRKTKFIEFIKNEILSNKLGEFNSKLIENLVDERYDSFVGKRIKELDKIKERIYKFKISLNDQSIDSKELINQLEKDYIGKYEPKEYGFDLVLIENLIKECQKQYEENNISIFNNINIDAEINEVLEKTKKATFTVRNMVYGSYDESRIFDAEFRRQDSERIYNFLSNNQAYLKQGEVLTKERIYNYLTTLSKELKTKAIKHERTVSTRFDISPYEESAKEILINNGMSELVVTNKIFSSSNRKIEELVKIKDDLKDIALIISSKLSLTRDEKDGFLFHIFGIMIDNKLLINIGSSKAFNEENMTDFILEIIKEKNNGELDIKYYLSLIKPIINSMGLNKFYNQEKIENKYKNDVKVMTK